MERGLGALGHQTVLITPDLLGGLDRLPLGLRNIVLALWTASRILRDPSHLDAVHANQPHVQSIAALLAARIRRCQFVVTYHLGLPASRNVFVHILLISVDRILRFGSPKVVYVSRATAREFGAEQDKVIYIGMDIALAQSAMGDGAARGLGRFTFAYVGRQTRNKGFFDLLDAVQNLAAELGRGAFRLVLIGEAPAEEAAEKANRLSDLQGVVEDQGNITGRMDRLRVLAAADALVLPSYREGLPLALLEALSVGCVPITTPVGGVTEVVKPGRTGILVPPGNVAALQKALFWAVGNHDAMASMRNEGRETVVSALTFEHTLEQYLELYGGP